MAMVNNMVIEFMYAVFVVLGLNVLSCSWWQKNNPDHSLRFLYLELRTNKWSLIKKYYLNGPGFIHVTIMLSCTYMLRLMIQE